MVDKSIIDIIQNYLQVASNSGLHISEAILFGSYAKDNFDEDSDLDLLLVCSDFNENSSEEIKNKLWSLRAKTDSRIEPIPIAEQEWEKGAGGIIADIARSEGIRILGSVKREAESGKREEGRMAYFRFEDLEIWQLAKKLTVKFHKVADRLEKRKLYRYAKQIRAAGLSISNNIAEGSGFSSSKEFS